MASAASDSLPEACSLCVPLRHSIFLATSCGVVRCLPFWLGLCVCFCCVELLQVCWSSDLRMCSSKSESQGHPDPAKFHLNIVAKFLDKHLSRCAAYRIEDAAVFWDFGSLYQKERTKLQEESFKEGLKASNRWCGSTQSAVWSGSLSASASVSLPRVKIPRLILSLRHQHMNTICFCWSCHVETPITWTTCCQQSRQS